MIVFTQETDFEFWSFIHLNGISLHAFAFETLRKEVINNFKIDILTILN